jgi:hypothetical protein
MLPTHLGGGAADEEEEAEATEDWYQDAEW